MAWQDNAIIKSHDGVYYIIRETPESPPYSVCPLDIDPINLYNFDEVAATWAALPDDDAKKVLAEDPYKASEQSNIKLLDAFERKVVSYLQSFVRERGYDSVADCVSYMHSPTGQRYVEAYYVLVTREYVWNVWYGLRGKIEAGTIEMPANWSEVLDQLPVLEWPEDYVAEEGDIAAKDMAERLLSKDTNNALSIGSDELLFTKSI